MLAPILKIYRTALSNSSLPVSPSAGAALETQQEKMREQQHDGICKFVDVVFS